MLDRIRSNDKVKVQFYLEPGTIKYIRTRSAEADKTQSKYIADLIEADMQIDHGQHTLNSGRGGAHERG